MKIARFEVCQQINFRNYKNSRLLQNQCPVFQLINIDFTATSSFLGQSRQIWLKVHPMIPRNLLLGRFFNGILQEKNCPFYSLPHRLAVYQRTTQNRSKKIAGSGKAHSGIGTLHITFFPGRNCQITDVFFFFTACHNTCYYHSLRTLCFPDQILTYFFDSLNVILFLTMRCQAFMSAHRLFWPIPAFPAETLPYTYQTLCHGLP